MSTCRNCLHSVVCFDGEGTTRYYGKELAANNVEHLCPNYKDRSRFVELPCPIGATVYIIGGKYRGGRFERWINTGEFRICTQPYRTRILSHLEAIGW